MRPVLLIVLDGFGHSDHVEGNAVAQAAMPFWRLVQQKNKIALLDASGEAVGLPPGQMGNSEVGHMTIGAGRVVDQDLPRINKSIENRSFFSKKQLWDLLSSVRARGGRLHVLGLTSNGGVHSHLQHGLAVVEAARQQGIEDICWHAFLDGRDAPPTDAADVVAQLERRLAEIGGARIASLVGRFDAMDRDQRWDRTQWAYQLLVQGVGRVFPLEKSAEAAVREAYARGETDEFIHPIVMTCGGQPLPRITPRDAVVFFNFRADRARQLSHALVDSDFSPFPRTVVMPPAQMLLFTAYDEDLGTRCPVLFPHEEVTGSLPAQLAAHGVSQLRVAETEKYAHVTYFFNGGREEPFLNEHRVLIDSNRTVRTYDQDPGMRTVAITDAVEAALRQQQHGFVLVNFASPDMVGHTGSMAATMEALSIVDRCLARLVSAAQQTGFSVVITADHGNCEQMVDPNTGQPHTAHTTSRVPCVVIRQPPVSLRPRGGLQDVAPTILALMDLPCHAEMTGVRLVDTTHNMGSAGKSKI